MQFDGNEGCAQSKDDEASADKLTEVVANITSKGLTPITIMTPPMQKLMGSM